MTFIRALAIRRAPVFGSLPKLPNGPDHEAQKEGIARSDEL
jgi:hypothetical protein